MTPRFIVAMLGGAIAAGCGANDPDIAYASDHTPYSRSAYQSGHSEAEADLRAGRLILEDYGFPRKGQAEFATILRQRYQIELRRVASDIVDPKSIGHAFGYNDVSKPEIKRRFGPNVLEEAEREAANNYDVRAR